jgi:FkbM family methyltransferase
MDQKTRKKITTVGAKIDALKRDAYLRRALLLKRNHVNVVLDVGANTGQYATQLRRIGYGGKIISFEPVSRAFAKLAKKVQGDRAWFCSPVALGDQDTTAEILVADDDRASSFLPMLPAHRKVASYFQQKKKEPVRVRKLDSIFKDLCRPQDRVFLKLDAQGFERQILKGARLSLPKIAGLQIELSIVPLYKGEPEMLDQIAFIKKMGFQLMSLEYGFCDPKTGQMLQVDGIFFREKPHVKK